MTTRAPTAALPAPQVTDSAALPAQRASNRPVDPLRSEPLLGDDSRQLLYDVRSLVESGQGAVLTLPGPAGAWLEIAGPKGMPPFGDGYCQARRTAVRLWRNDTSTPLAEATADAGFAAGLDTVARAARIAFGAEHPFLTEILAAIAEGASGHRPRATSAGATVRVTGSPDAAGWFSCLTLADLQGAVAEACRAPERGSGS